LRQRIDEGRWIGHLAVELAPVFAGELGAEFCHRIADVGIFVWWLGGGHLNSAGRSRAHRSPRRI
jgi:hypothetical protein